MEKSLDNLHVGDTDGPGTARGLDAGDTETQRSAACLKDRVMTFNCGGLSLTTFSTIGASKCL